MSRTAAAEENARLWRSLPAPVRAQLRLFAEMRAAIERRPGWEPGTLALLAVQAHYLATERDDPGDPPLPDVEAVLALGEEEQAAMRAMLASGGDA